METSVQTGTEAPAAPPSYDFAVPGMKPPNVMWQYLGGIAFIGMAVIGFVISVFAHVGQFSLQAMTTMPLLGGAGMLMRAWSQEHAPLHASVTPEGIRVATSKQTDFYAWSQIGWATVQSNGFTHRRELTLLDRQGKPLAKLDQSLEPFEYLTQLVVWYIAIHADAATEQIKHSKAKRNGFGLIAAGIFFMALALANICLAYRSEQAAQLLKTTGVPGRAEITRCFLAPNGVTPRVEYRITAPNGRTATSDVEVHRDYWEILTRRRTVPVVYAPSDPGVSRLAMGQVEDHDLSNQPVAMYLLSGLILAISIVSMVSGVLSFKGWDVRLDQKTGRISMRRYGSL